ncbi:MAG TPA: EAL domain-containing protein [Steroidobacteraceae bacterium]|nr:EAL domain-containing protein [Steroidobacteraceae bacterium]
MKSEGTRLLAEASLLAAEQCLRARPAAHAAGLIEALAHGVSSMLNATSVTGALPGVLERIAGVVPLQRLSITELRTEQRVRPPPEQGVLFHWQAPLLRDVPMYAAAGPAPRWQQALALAEQLPEWLQPLASGSHVLATHGEASEPVRAVLAESRATALLAVPIMLDGRHWGQILFEDGEGIGGWHSEELRMLSMLAEVIGAALTRERFLAQVREREALLRAINQGAALIMSAADLQPAIARALGTAAEAIGVDRVLVTEEVESSEGGARRRQLRCAWRASGVALKLPELVQLLAHPYHPEVATWLEPLASGVAVQARLSAAGGAVRELLRRFESCALLLVPVMVDGRHWGHISLSSGRCERVWSSAEVDGLKTLAELIGTAIARERQVQALATADTIIQHSPTILYRLRGEPDLPMIYVSQNVSLLGHEAADLLATPKRYLSYIHGDDRVRVQEAMTALLARQDAPEVLEFRLLARDGSQRWVENRLRPVHGTDGRLLEIEGILSDITERRAAQEQIAQLARSDALTGLANRVTFNDRLRQAFASSQRGAHAFAVLYLDLDRFKEINDTLGHHTGDVLLQQVGARLRQATREIDVVARLGGDEFAIVQSEIIDSASAGTLAEKVIEILSAPFEIAGSQLRVGVSIGIALYSPEARNPEELLAHADQALYRAKHAGRGRYRFHSDQIDHETRAQLELADGLRGAIERNELEIRYQPQVELASGRIMGMEALLRWDHPKRGVLLPEDFLPIAEKYGIMQQLGRWVLDEACRQMSLWRAQQIPVPVVAINVALAQIRTGREFVRDVVDALERWQIKPADIELDVTELVLARSTLAQSGVLEELRQLGVGIAIDDFGAHYSSLDYLRTYRVSRLKIARGMVAAADAEPGGGAMIRAILSLARELGIEVVAEGVETEAQCRLLVDASARAQGQGFYFSHAVPAEDTMRMLRTGIIAPADGAPATPGVPDQGLL